MNQVPGSETSTVADIVAPYCKGKGIDMGFGGLAVTHEAWTFDMVNPYVKLSVDPQILRGDCRDLHFICDNALNYLFSSHLLEDFDYQTLSKTIIPEWKRVLQVGGLLVINCPDQQRFLAHIKKTNQGDNLAHKEADFSLRTFKEK